MAKSRRRLHFSMEKDNIDASPGTRCELCHDRNRKFFTINTIKNEKNQEYAIEELGQKQHCTICHLCRDDITRINRYPEYKLRWRNQRREKEKCEEACLWIQNLYISDQFLPLLQGWTHPLQQHTEWLHNIRQSLTDNVGQGPV